MDNTAATPKNPPKKKRPVKDLPPSLVDVFNKDSYDGDLTSVIKFRLEDIPDRKDDKEMECMVAYAVTGVDGTEFNLDKDLSLDQLRVFCRKAGCHYINSKNKFQCRRALHIAAEFNKKMHREGAAVTTATERMTNNIVRITNIVFSHDFFESFTSLNDAKNRADHESGNIPKKFWADVAEAMNCSNDDDNSSIQMVIKEDDPRAEVLKDLDLDEFDVMTADSIKKKINTLFKVRREVQKNMTVSGEHDSDSFNFMDVAMKNVGAGQSLTKLGCYYFFKRCDENKEVDEKFVVGVEPGIKGNSDDISIITSEDPTTLSSQKKRAYSAIAELNDVAKTIAEQMKESNRLVQISTDEMKEKNRLVQQSNVEKKKKNHLAEQSNIISLATTLGNRELLQTLLGSMVSSATNPSSEDPMRSSSSSES